MDSWPSNTAAGNACITLRQACMYCMHSMYSRGGGRPRARDAVPRAVPATLRSIASSTYASTTSVDIVAQTRTGFSSPCHHDRAEASAGRALPPVGAGMCEVGSASRFSAFLKLESWQLEQVSQALAALNEEDGEARQELTLLLHHLTELAQLTEGAPMTSLSCCY